MEFIGASKGLKSSVSCGKVIHRDQDNMPIPSFKFDPNMDHKGCLCDCSHALFESGLSLLNGVISVSLKGPLCKI